MSRALIVPAATALVLGLSACGAKTADTTAAPGGIAVSSTSSTCTLSTTTAPAGTTTFHVTNDGDTVTEFYVYAADGTSIVGEVENIGPAITRELTVSLEPGTFTTACKPGESGDGIRAAFTVTGATASASTSSELTIAASAYKAWVEQQSTTLLERTTSFVAAVKVGDLARARALYAPSRAYYERIEPVAESFGDLDPRIDARENDVAAGEEWTGWHRLEKALWAQRSTAGTAAVADQLLADTRELVTRIQGITLKADQVTNGAKELLDEVATSKVTGEEERYSHTDLWDFQANLDGSRKAYDVVRSIVVAKDPALATQLDAEFAQAQRSLDAHRSGDGFALYTSLTPAQVKALAAQVEALSEPLSTLTSTVLP